MSHLHSDLITQSCQVSLKTFMFALQSLDAGQVVTVVVGGEGLVFLFNPLFGLIRIPEEAQTQSRETEIGSFVSAAGENEVGLESDSGSIPQPPTPPHHFFHTTER